MDLTEKGMKALKLNKNEKLELANNLLGGWGSINDYVKGVYYDAVLFIRCLLGKAPSNKNLINDPGHIIAKRYLTFGGHYWDGNSSITRGSSIVFETIQSNEKAKYFHASISLGGTLMRGVNGGLLGSGWLLCDLNTHIAQITPINSKLYLYDRREIRILVTN